MIAVWSCNENHSRLEFDPVKGTLRENCMPLGLSSMTRASALAVAVMMGASCSSASSTTAGDGAGVTAATSPSTSVTAITGPVIASSAAGADVGVGGGPCPVATLPVVVSVDQWSDIVAQLGGRCTAVTAIVADTSDDPHEYEPTAADTATFTGAGLIVVNGGGYDPWAEKAIGALSAKPAVVNAGAIVDAAAGANPHFWYSPAYVVRVAAAITTELSKLSPEASPYFAARAVAWRASMQPYFDEIAAVKKLAAGKTYAATESVFDYTAEAVGLTNATPEGYQYAVANDSDPAPGSINDFQQALTGKTVDILIFNTQTESAITEQIRAVATKAAVPVVDVTETLPPGVDSFEQWQVSQLKSLELGLR